MSAVHYRLTNHVCDYEKLRNDWVIDTTKMNLNKTFEKTLIYFNSVVNYSIWKMRNDIKFKFKRFEIKTLVNKIRRSMGARNATESKLAESFKIPYLNKLYDNFVVISNSFPFDNG